MLDWKNTGGWTVLVVDDEPDNLEVVATVLSFFGMTVKTATDGIQGLEQLKHLTPTLILLDLAMPHMDGWRMFEELRKIPHLQQVPVVALTAHAMIGDEQRVLAAGFDGYLSKPVNLPTLVQDIEQAIAKKANGANAQDTPASVENTPQTPASQQVEDVDKPIGDFSVKEIPQ
ncbi:MAG: response regulator [Anaerolineae bacterium]|nr:MAG: response regulator [Anaerolineae bacterium]